jgi:hypothetical protein
LIGGQVSRYREPQAGDRETGQTEDGVKTPEDIEAEIWQHALDLAEPAGLRRLVGHLPRT